MTDVVYAACFLVLATSSGLAVATGPRWLLRLPLLAATPVLAIAVWWQLSQRDGWPAGLHPADGSTFVAGVVQSPTPGHAGAIYLWAQPPNSSAPRSYRLPYSPQLERQVARAARQAKRGVPVAVRRSRHARGRHGLQTVRSVLSFYRATSQPVETKSHR